MEEIKRSPYEISVESKICCLNIACVHNVPVPGVPHHACNLKGMLIDETGMCSGVVTIKPKKSAKAKKQ